MIAETGTGAGAALTSRPSAASALASLTHFELAERLVQIWIRNQRNLNRLEELEARIEQTERHGASAVAEGSRGGESRPNPGFERLAILLRLRSDDRLASALLDEFEARRRANDARPRAFTA